MPRCSGGERGLGAGLLQRVRALKLPSVAGPPSHSLMHCPEHGWVAFCNSSALIHPGCISGHRTPRTAPHLLDHSSLRVIVPEPELSVRPRSRNAMCPDAFLACPPCRQVMQIYMKCKDEGYPVPTVYQVAKSHQRDVGRSDRVYHICSDAAQGRGTPRPVPSTSLNFSSTSLYTLLQLILWGVPNHYTQQRPTSQVFVYPRQTWPRCEGPSVTGAACRAATTRSPGSAR